MWLKGNDIKNGSATGSDYWAAYIGGAKIKTDGPKQQTSSNVITWVLMTYLTYKVPSWTVS